MKAEPDAFLQFEQLQITKWNGSPLSTSLTVEQRQEAWYVFSEGMESFLGIEAGYKVEVRGEDDAQRVRRMKCRTSGLHGTSDQSEAFRMCASRVALPAFKLTLNFEYLNIECSQK